MLPDQLPDRIFAQESSFFGNGCTGHVPFSEPLGVACQQIAEAAQRASVRAQNGGTAVCMEGTQFSTAGTPTTAM